jgi:hypothetical protein
MIKGEPMADQFKRNINVEAIEFENEMIVLQADRYTVTKLNEVGGFCWSLLIHPMSIKNLAAEVQKRYDITEQEAQNDIENFLAELLKLGLVQRANGR